MNELLDLDEYKGLIHKLSKKYKFAGLPYEDIESAGLEGLAVAYNTYDPTKGAKFSTWVWTCAQNTIRAEVATMSRQHTISTGALAASRLATATANDELMPEFVDCMSLEDALYELYEDEFTGLLSFELTLDDFLATLPELEATVFKMRMEGGTYCGIGRELGLNRMKVSRMVERLNEDYLAFVGES